MPPVAALLPDLPSPSELSPVPRHAALATPPDPPMTATAAALSDAGAIPPLPLPAELATPVDPVMAPVAASLPGPQGGPSPEPACKPQVPALPPHAEIATPPDPKMAAVAIPLPAIAGTCPANPQNTFEIPPLPPPAEIDTPPDPAMEPAAAFLPSVSCACLPGAPNGFDIPPLPRPAEIDIPAAAAMPPLPLSGSKPLNHEEKNSRKDGKMTDDEIKEIAKRIAEYQPSSHVVYGVCFLAILILACGMFLLWLRLTPPGGTAADSLPSDEPKLRESIVAAMRRTGPTWVRMADSLRPYALQLLGLTFVLPVVLVSAALGKLTSEAFTGLLGAIIGYIFGSAKSAPEGRGGAGQGG
jgi:hypothetical protein